MSSEPTPEKPPASRIFRLSEDLKDKNIGKIVTVGVAGNGGSFSEAAAVRFQKDRAIAVMRVVYLITAEAVMSALDRGEIDYSVVATHNNHGGTALENQKALGEHRYTPEANVVLPVNHMLMTLPEARRRIRFIVTQAQAYEQCKETVRKRYPRALVIPAYADTATAAKDLASGALPGEVRKLPGFENIVIDPSATAVVGPENCGEENHLVVRRRNVQDNPDNKTTFVVGKRFVPPEEWA